VHDDLLLCELHAHTTWSDGVLGVAELVDLYGARGFDVLAITDHTVRLDDAMPSSVDPWTWPAYARCVRDEAERAAREYGLLVLLGLELTDNQVNPDLSAHALALGLERFVSIDAGLTAALEGARDAGAAIVAAHPSSSDDPLPRRPTRRFHSEHQTLRGLVHRYELFNRNETFAWVAEERLPPVATGDFHRADHVASWKTLLRCERDEQAVVACLRSQARVYLTPYAVDERMQRPLAA
jgi:predicted metal-dependent phosphoesterase TrpH